MSGRRRYKQIGWIHFDTETNEPARRFKGRSWWRFQKPIHVYRTEAVAKQYAHENDIVVPAFIIANPNKKDNE